MRVVQAIETTGPGGAERLLLNLSRSLVESGHTVSVLLLGEGWLLSRLQEMSVDTAILPLRRPIDGSFVMSLRRELQRRNADVFHSHEFTFAVYGRLATLGRQPHVATLHGVNFVRGTKRRWLCRLLLRRTRRFRLVAVSRWLADEVSRATGIPASTLETAPNGILVSEPRPPLQRRASEPLRIVAVGNLYPVKNHGLAIAVVAALTRRGVPVELEILGRGSEAAALEASIERHRLGDRVRLCGFQEDVTEFLDHSHLLLSTSKSEGMPISFIEAMARGLPVVATQVGGVAEIVRDGVEGRLVPPDDEERLVAALDELFADESLRLRLGRQARVRAEEFSIERTRARYLELYASVGGGTGNARNGADRWKR
jgi:glycosyltransferase involved in cell wall biosynthesis